jgi:hypothetical protein
MAETLTLEIAAIYRPATKRVLKCTPGAAEDERDDDALATITTSPPGRISPARRRFILSCQRILKASQTRSGQNTAPNRKLKDGQSWFHHGCRSDIYPDM